MKTTKISISSPNIHNVPVHRYLLMLSMIFLFTNYLNAQSHMIIATRAKDNSSYETTNSNFRTTEGANYSKTLDLSNEDLTGIPVSIYDMRSLECLNLDNDRIIWIPADIRNLKNLRILTIGKNVFELPDELRQLLLLVELHLPYEQWQYRLDEVRKITKAKIILD